MNTEIGKIAASMQGKQRKPNRSMSRTKYGKLQPVKGAALRTWDSIAKFLGLTVGTPLQIKLNKLAYFLFGCALLLAIIVFGVNKFNVTNEVAIYAVSTGIAIIPESLIAVLTITFVVGMTQMRKRKVVTRQLSALEALGGITNICSDKTGTLTQGLMITRKVWIPGTGVYSVDDSTDANDPTKGKVTLGPEKSASEVEKEQEQKAEELDTARSTAAVKFDVPEQKLKKESTIYKKESAEEEVTISPPLESFLQASSLCNLATVRFNEKEKRWQTTGDPTEIALQVFAHRFDHGKKALEGLGWKQNAEYPFDSTIKRMTVIYQSPDASENIILTKGAVERIIDLCSSIGLEDNNQLMTDTLKASVLEQMRVLASQGLRVLAIARRSLSSNVPLDKSSLPPRNEIENDLTLLGLAGLYDPPRLETKDAVRECSNAGIKVHMLTGDHPDTAVAIAKEVGIIPRNMGVLSTDIADSIVKTAAQFDGMSEADIDALPELPLVIARCAPDTKTRMISALHRRKLYAAMTGDGVNDAPSLKAADVGLAMGMAGSDVAKGAADVILTDDNFASIVGAIEEGRRMFDNIQKFILHLLFTNVAEVLVLIAGLAFQDSTGFSVFPLSPLQILWINMITSSFPSFGLGREKAAWNIMTRPPHDNRKGVFTWQVIADMMVYGVLLGTLCLMTFIIVVYGRSDLGMTAALGLDCNTTYSETCDVVFRARAAVFAELTWAILLAAWELKDLRRSLLRLNPGSEKRFTLFADLWENQFLFWAVIIAFASVFPAIYIPYLNTDVFKHRGIDWEWAVVVGFVLLFVLGVELWKLTKRLTGWFGDGQVEPEKGARGDRRSLKQGFFTFAKSLTPTWSMEKKSDVKAGVMKKRRADSGSTTQTTWTTTQGSGTAV